MSGSEFDNYWKLEDFEDIIGGLDSGLEGSTKHQNSKDTQNRNRRGKRKSAATQLLRRLARKGSNPLKKEYVRTQLVRGHKKALRLLIKSNKSRAIEEISQPSLQQQFLLVYQDNRELLKALAKPSSGPLTDAKASRGTTKSTPKTCNDTFCSQYFSHNAARESFYYYTEMLFEGLCPVRLSEHFNARCCDGPTHDLDCTNLWEEFKEFVQVSLIETLGFVPFRPETKASADFETSLF